MRKERAVDFILTDLEKCLEISGGLCLQIFHIGIESFQQQRPDCRIRLTAPEAADFGLFENIVSPQNFVAEPVFLCVE